MFYIFCSGDQWEKILNILLPYCQNLKALTDNLGNTLLHEAAISGIPKIVRILLEKGLYLETENGRGKTPMDSAVFNGNLEIIKEFINNYDPSRYQQLLDNAITDRKEHIAQFLVLNPPKHDSVDMHDAVQNCQLETVKDLVKRLAKPNAQNQFLLSPLHIAVNKYAKITKLKRNGTKSKTENAGTYTEIVKLISFSCDNHDCQDFDGNTTLHIAAREGLIEIVEILMPFSENLLIENVREETPLTLAYGRDDSYGDSIADLLMKEIESRCQ